MLYVVLIAVLLIPISIIAGLVIAYRKLSRPYFSLLLFLLIAGPFATFKIYERNFMLSFVPDALGVSSISYREEESWGFGPGGNEAGIRIYPLSEQVAKKIAEGGIEFFNNMPPNQHQRDRGWRGSYSKWSETPIKPSDHWKPSEKSESLNIYDYICAYGFCIDIKPEVVEEANSIVNSAGSYYAYGRIGLIIVSPKKQLVLYIYNG